MKKVLLIVLCVICLVGCGSKELKDKATEFKKEYESLNGNNVEVIIDDSVPVYYLDSKGVVDFLQNKTGIIYFGFPACPWCRNVLPVLLEVAKENNYPIYYFDSSSLADSDTDFSQVMTVLHEYLEESEDGIKTLYVPDVYFVKDGKIEGHHLSSVESQEDPYVPLTDEQKNELKKIYQDLFVKIG